MLPRHAREVAVVGAGAAGLVAAHELHREGHAVAVFERSARVGGTWAYDDDDPPPASAGSSMYASLRTNLPRELMGFSGHGLADGVFAGDPRVFPGHREVLAFLRAFADESGVVPRVRLRAEVLRLAPVAGRCRGGEEEVEEEERWSVAWRDGEEGDVAVEAFDAVVVCTGHCSVPLVPKLPGTENWRGKQMHSHRYRTPEPLRDQVVVVVGLGASGIDIAREISHVAKEVHIASRHDEHRLGKIDLYRNVWMHTEVNCIQDDGQVRFGEGTTMAADTILYCTGYRYHFPFLDHLDGLSVDEDDNYVGPLYKHVFPLKYAPGLSFVGLPSKTIIFQTLELVSRWVARTLSGRVALPDDESMLATVREHCRRMEESGKPRRHTHVLVPDWVEYMGWLAEQVGEPPLEARRRELYERALRCIRSLDDAYRDQWEEEGGTGVGALQE